MLRQLSEPDMTQQPLCIVYPATIIPFEVKTGLIHLLPQFIGRAGEDPHKHLKDFHVVCEDMRPHGVTEEQLNLRAFFFSLKEDVKDQLYYQPPSLITTWNRMKKLFLDKYFSASKANNIRNEIYGIT